MPGYHELRAARPGTPGGLGPGHGSGQTDLQERDRQRPVLFRLCRRLRPRRLRDGGRPPPQGAAAAGRIRVADQGRHADGAGSQSGRPVAQAHLRGGGRQSPAAGARLRRRAGDPPPSPWAPRPGGGADRGDARGAARRGARGQGALPGRLVDVRLAVRGSCSSRRGCTAGPGSWPCRTTTT